MIEMRRLKNVLTSIQTILSFVLSGKTGYLLWRFIATSRVFFVVFLRLMLIIKEMASLKILDRDLFFRNLVHVHVYLKVGLSSPEKI